MSPITFPHLQLEPASSGPVLTLEEIVQQVKKQAIQAALERNNKNVARAARELGISRVTLYRLMDKNHLDLNRQERKSA